MLYAANIQQWNKNRIIHHFKIEENGDTNLTQFWNSVTQIPLGLRPRKNPLSVLASLSSGSRLCVLTHPFFRNGSWSLQLSSYTNLFLAMRIWRIQYFFIYFFVFSFSFSLTCSVSADRKFSRTFIDLPYMLQRFTQLNKRIVHGSVLDNSVW